MVGADSRARTRRDRGGRRPTWHLRRARRAPLVRAPRPHWYRCPSRLLGDRGIGMVGDAGLAPGGTAAAAGRRGTSDPLLVRGELVPVFTITYRSVARMYPQEPRGHRGQCVAMGPPSRPVGHCKYRAPVHLPPRTQYLYASIHCQPSGGGFGSGRSSNRTFCRVRPLRQTATMLLSSVRSTFSTTASTPSTSVLKGRRRFSSMCVKRPPVCSSSPYASTVASSISASSSDFASLGRSWPVRLTDGFLRQSRVCMVALSPQAAFSR